MPTLVEQQLLPSDYHLPRCPDPHERFVFRARGMALRLHPQDEGIAMHVGIHPQTWEEWIDLGLEALRLARWHDVPLRSYPANMGQVDVGGTGVYPRREVIFYGPHEPDEAMPELARDLAWALANLIPVERIRA